MAGVKILGGVIASVAVAGLLAGCGTRPRDAAPRSMDGPPREVRGLRNAASFAGVADARLRAEALFTEAGKVLLHPRCVNCHPSTERPLQTDAQRPHQPPVVRGETGHGVAGMRCTTCHQSENVELGGWSVPGHPVWHLAPATMAWAGKSLAAICAQIKDPARNGGRDLEAVVEHMAEDSLVGWAWEPGSGRRAAPGTQAVFGKLLQGWAAAGAHCPRGSPPLASAGAPAP